MCESNRLLSALSLASVCSGRSFASSIISNLSRCLVHLGMPGAGSRWLAGRHRHHTASRPLPIIIAGAGVKA